MVLNLFVRLIRKGFVLFAFLFVFSLVLGQAAVHSITGESVEISKFCPKGHSEENIVPIAYGYPGPGMLEDADKGLVKLGGCVISGNDPHWYCQVCQSRWE